MPFETNLIRNVSNHYGPRLTDSRFGGRIENELVKSVQWSFNHTQVGTALGSVQCGVGALEYSIPANSTILSATLQIITAFTSTSTLTDLNIGLEQADGTDISLSGLITAAQANQTAIAVVGSVILGSSGTPAALIGLTIGAANGELIVQASTADLLTGRARLIVTYIRSGL